MTHVRLVGRTYLRISDTGGGKNCPTWGSSAVMILHGNELVGTQFRKEEWIPIAVHIQSLMRVSRSYSLIPVDCLHIRVAQTFFHQPKDPSPKKQGFRYHECPRNLVGLRRMHAVANPAGLTL